jgi:hypothetical protein
MSETRGSTNDRHQFGYELRLKGTSMPDGQPG